MGFMAAQYVFNLTGLTSTQLVILQRVGWSCRDDDGFLDRGAGWLADKCSLSLRSLERHLPALEKLGLLARHNGGFYLPGFRVGFRQFGGESSASLSANLAEKEKNQKKKNSEGTYGNYARARGAETETGGLLEFTFALCRLCDPEHRWLVAEGYFDTRPRELVCPEFRARLSGKVGVTS